MTGIAPHAFHEVLAKGGGGGVALDRMAPFILDRDPSGLQFTVANSAKDLGYYTQMCRDLGAGDAVAAAIHGLLTAQVEAGNGAAFVPTLAETLAKG